MHNATNQKLSRMWLVSMQQLSYCSVCQGTIQAHPSLSLSLSPTHSSTGSTNYFTDVSIPYQRGADSFALFKCYWFFIYAFICLPKLVLGFPANDVYSMFTHGRIRFHTWRARKFPVSRSLYPKCCFVGHAAVSITVLVSLNFGPPWRRKPSF